MNNSAYKTIKRKRRHAKVRSKISGTETRPRLSVYRSNKGMYVQLIDDTKGVTLAQANDMGMTSGTGIEKAQHVGKTIAEAAKALHIEAVVFDRGGNLYAGRIKALAESAREAGLNF